MGKTKVLIIGGGVAGLFAARTLVDNGITDIRIITKTIGGRVETSKNGAVNYGTYFVIPRYERLLPYLQLTRRMWKWHIGFVNEGKVRTLISPQTLLLLPQLIRLTIACMRCNHKISAYRKKCVHLSQKHIIESDPYLLRLYNMKGSEIVSLLGIQDVAATFIDQTINVIGFDHYDKSNALDLLKWIAAIYLNPMYEFQLNQEKLLRGFASNIILDEVRSIETHPSHPGYSVRTDTDQWGADYVIVATEPWVTKKLLSLQSEDPLYTVSHVRQVTGTPKGIALTNKRYLCFPSGQGILSICKESDGSFLVYTATKETDIGAYFDDYTVLFEKTWNPSFTFCSHELVESRQAERLWIAGDINFAGIEDSALTGIYAANQITEDMKKNEKR